MVKLRPYLAKIARPDFDGVCSTDILPILPGADVNRDYLVRDDDEEAKRFDLLLLRAQLCTLNAEPGWFTIVSRVRVIADALLGQTAIPAIREQQVFLEALAGADWWQDVTLPMLEQARVRVRGLVKLLAKTKRKIVYTDFEDQLGDVDEIAITPGSGQLDITRFRAKARDFLYRHEDHLALHKLRRNAPLTEADLAELERMLSESGELDVETLSRSVQEAEGLHPAGYEAWDLVRLTGVLRDADAEPVKSPAGRCTWTPSASRWR